MENDLKEKENYFDLTGARGSSYRGFELPGVDCTLFQCFSIKKGPNLEGSFVFT